MYLMDQQFGAFDHIVIGLPAGCAGEAVILYLGMGIASGAENFYWNEGDIQLNGLELFLCSRNCLEGILQQQGFHIGQQANFEVNGLQLLEVLWRKFCFQGIEYIANERYFVHRRWFRIQRIV